MTQNWQLHYILGTLDLEGQRRILDIAGAVAKLLAVSIRCFGHPAYESGANQLGAGDIHSLELVSATGPGSARFDGDEDNATYWAMTIELRTTENTTPNIGHERAVSGIDIDLDVGGGGSPSLNRSLIVARSDEDPNA